MTASSPLLYDVTDGVATLTLNRPDRLNALDVAITDALADRLSTLAGDSAIRAVILTGAGRAFMAGGDIGMFARLIAETDRADRPAQMAPLIAKANRVTQTLITMPQPTLAAIEGPCVGFGLSLMMACDLAIASESASFALGYGGIGTSPDGGATWLLPRLVGRRRAAEIALLGESFTAQQAADWGLLTRVCADGTALTAASGMAARLAVGAGAAQARTKHLLNTSEQSSLTDQMQAEAEAFAASSATDDFEEGVAAFLDRRAPHFRKIR